MDVPTYLPPRQVFPKGSPQAASKVIVWKRYNDFKKLHKELKARHQQLYLKDKFPPFAKAKMFGRFDEEVVETRRKSALLLLEFVGEHLPLFNSDVCSQFLKTGHSIDENEAFDLTRAQAPRGDFTLPSVSIVSPECDVETLHEAPAANTMLGGTWQFPQVSDTISISSLSSDDPTTFTDTDSSVVSGVGSPLHNSDLQFFDPLHQSPAKQPNAETLADSTPSNSWLPTSPPHSLPHSPDRQLLEYSPPSSAAAAESVRGNTELPVKMFLSVRTEDFHSANLSEMHRASQEAETPEAGLARPFSPSDLDNKSLNQNVNYIFEAAYHVGQAQLNEANGEFEAAFSFYKAGIGCLLCGVQDETDAKRKIVVSKKISKYLLHAEKLYKSHLVCQSAGRRQIISQLRRPLSELKSYRVLGVVGKLMLVMNSADDRCYAIKVLYKSSCPATSETVTIMPQNVPYMVKMHGYFETDSAVFLVLQHASGGRLWQHIGSYFQSCPASPISVFTNEDPFIGKTFVEDSRRGGFTSTFLKESSNFNVPKRGNLLAETETESMGDGDEQSYMELIEDYTASKKNHSEDSTRDRSKHASGSGEEVAPQCSHLNEDQAVGPLDAPEPQVLADDKTEHNYAWNILDSLPTQDLVKNAQRLLESVNETLIQSDAVVSRVNNEQRAAGGDDVKRERANPRRSVEKRRTSARRRSRPSSERRFSSDDMLLKSMEWCRLMTEAAPPRPRLPEGTVQSWAAQLLVCIDTLHRWGVKCRDLRPDNILLGDEGRLLVTYMCQWEGVDAMASPDAAHHLYSAPEVNGIFPYTQAADWWSYGAVVYELITGKTLHSSHPGGVLSHTIVNIPDGVSDSARSLLQQLLKHNPSERLGSGINAAEELKSHPFFSGVDWQAVLDESGAI